MAEELNQEDREIDSDIKNSDRDSVIDNDKLSENNELKDGTIEPKNLSDTEPLNDGRAEDSRPFETRELNDENTVQQSNMEDQLEYGDEEENFESISSQPEEDNFLINVDGMSSFSHSSCNNLFSSAPKIPMSSSTQDRSSFRTC